MIIDKPNILTSFCSMFIGEAAALSKSLTSLKSSWLMLAASFRDLSVFVASGTLDALEWREPRVGDTDCSREYV